MIFELVSNGRSPVILVAVSARVDPSTAYLRRRQALATNLDSPIQYFIFISTHRHIHIHTSSFLPTYLTMSHVETTFVVIVILFIVFALIGNALRTRYARAATYVDDDFVDSDAPVIVESDPVYVDEYAPSVTYVSRPPAWSWWPFAARPYRRRYRRSSIGFRPRYSGRRLSGSGRRYGSGRRASWGGSGRRLSGGIGHGRPLSFGSHGGSNRSIGHIRSSTSVVKSTPGVAIRSKWG